MAPIIRFCRQAVTPPFASTLISSRPVINWPFVKVTGDRKEFILGFHDISMEVV